MPMRIPCLRLSAMLDLEIILGLLLRSFAWVYGQARLHDESLVKQIDFGGSWVAKIKRRGVTVTVFFHHLG